MIITLTIILFGMLAFFFVVLPLFMKSSSFIYDYEAQKPSSDLDALLKRKQKIMNDIKDLDFEYQLGKMSDGDYQSLRQASLSEVAHVMQKVDNLPSNGKITDESIEKLIAKKRQKRSEKKCSSCGVINPLTSKFCSACGHSLA